MQTTATTTTIPNQKRSTKFTLILNSSLGSTILLDNKAVIAFLGIIHKWRHKYEVKLLPLSHAMVCCHNILYPLKSVTSFMNDLLLEKETNKDI